MTVQCPLAPSVKGQGDGIEQILLTATAVHIFRVLVPRLCLGTHGLAGSDGRMRGRASLAVGYEAETRNQAVCDPPRCAHRCQFGVFPRGLAL